MFIGYYELEKNKFFNIYYKNREGFRAWHADTFPPTCENINILNFTIKGKTYKEKQENLKNIAIDWQLNFSALDWSYGELATIQDYFYRNAKRYGLLKEFKENAIC